MFVNGGPDETLGGVWTAGFLTEKCYLPDVGLWIDKLGPVTEGKDRSSKRAERHRKRRRTAELTTQDREVIKHLKSQGATQRHIAEKYGVSQSYVHRLNAHESLPP